MRPSAPILQSRELIVATRNPGKAAELRALLEPLGVFVVDLQTAGIEPDPLEDEIESGATFEENARAKANYFAARAAGRAVLADDSGLCVAALGGAPGVRSRRYAGAVGSDTDVSDANCARLLEELRDVADRRAEFVCAVAFRDGKREVVCVGRTAGRILAAARGTSGFGYDPVFWSDELQLGFGDATRAEKASVSHRTRAFERLAAALGAWRPSP